jgi:hypothetical protein
MFVLGGATTGLWLASTGLVRLDRGFVLALAGSCSFCGKDRAQTNALLGTAGCSVKICDECVGLCCEIISEEMDLSAHEPRREGHPSVEDEAFQQRVAESSNASRPSKIPRARVASSMTCVARSMLVVAPRSTCFDARSAVLTARTSRN